MGVCKNLTSLITSRPLHTEPLFDTPSCPHSSSPLRDSSSMIEDLAKPIRHSCSFEPTKACQELEEHHTNARLPQIPSSKFVANNPADPTSTKIEQKPLKSPIGSHARPCWVPGRYYEVLPQRLYFTGHVNDEQTMREIRQNPRDYLFSTELQDRYLPFCADFGPVNLGAVAQFCEYMQSKLDEPRLASRRLVYYCSTDHESVSNTAFLLACYLLLKQSFSPQEAVRPFLDVLDIPIVGFRDPTFIKSTFDISLWDCLHGLHRARSLGWFDLTRFDLEQYDNLMDLASGGDISILSPKFVAFRGPKDIIDSEKVFHTATPAAYVDELKKLGVSAIVRLNEADSYDKTAFEGAGFAHHDLHFADCSTPSDEVVAQFFELCEGEQMVAVHCMAGLGRTGTMVGLWLMHRHAFSACEAIAWMRIVRPGCVIGPQQHYLKRMERRLRDGSFPYSLQKLSSLRLCAAPASPSLNSGADTPSAALSQDLSRQIRLAVLSRSGAGSGRDEGSR